MFIVIPLLVSSFISSVRVAKLSITVSLINAKIAKELPLYSFFFSLKVYKCIHVRFEMCFNSTICIAR